MLNHTWQSQLVAVGVNSAIFVGLTLALLPFSLLFITLSGEPPMWQKVAWYTVFPLAGLHWPDSIWSIFICFLSNAVLWGVLVQLIVRLCSLKRSGV
ncbi:hypothetical protein [Spirosoma pulveris]